MSVVYLRPPPLVRLCEGFSCNARAGLGEHVVRCLMCNIALTIRLAWLADQRANDGVREQTEAERQDAGSPPAPRSKLK